MSCRTTTTWVICASVVVADQNQRGKLLTHSADTEAELEQLHGADRLMVRLIQLPHLADRVKGMLFQVRFAQNMELLKQVSNASGPKANTLLIPNRVSTS